MFHLDGIILNTQIKYVALSANSSPSASTNPLKETLSKYVSFQPALSQPKLSYQPKFCTRARRTLPTST